MRSDSPDTRSTKLRSGLRTGGLCVLAAAALSAATFSPEPSCPSGGRIIAAPSQAPVLALDQDQPIAGKVSVARPASVTAGPSGYVLMSRRLIGETPVGLNVWLDRGAAHRASIGPRVSRTVAELRSLGLPVRWRGYGRPKPAQGVVQVSENSSGCQGGSNVIGMTWPYWMALPNGDLYTYRANIALCPTLFTRYGSWQWDATVRHELAHAMGLGHTNYVFRGSYQVMNAVTHYGVTRYRAGDVNGLRRLGANSIRVKREIPPSAHFDRSSWASDNRIVFTGWALLKYYKTRGVGISLSDNGHVIARHSTSVIRADVNRRYDPGRRAHGFSFSTPWHGGRHTYCISATSSVSRVAVAKLGCVSWNS